MRLSKRVFRGVASLVIAGAVGVAAGGASAYADSGHATTEPAANTVIIASPAHVTVRSSAPIDAAKSSAKVFSQSHKSLATAPATVGAADPTQLIIDVPKLDKGIYTVVWHLTATTGASLGDGTSAFQVDPAGPAGPGGQQQGPAGPGGQQQGPPASIVQQPKPAPVTSPARKVLAKWLSFLFVMVFIGALAVRFLVTAPAARRAGSDDADRADLLHTTDRRLVIVAGASLVAFLPAVWAELAYEVSGVKVGFWKAIQPSTIWKYLSTQVAGHFWEVRLGLIALAVLVTVPAAIAVLRRSPAAGTTITGPSKPAATLMSIGLFAAAAEIVVGTIPTTRPAAHAMARAVFTSALDAGHLLSASMWVGGLVALAALTLVRLPARQASLFWPNAMPRFSMAATLSLGTIVLTGLWTAWIHVASPSQLFTTIYGERLLIKLILLACLAGLGPFNLFWVLPRAAEIRRHGDRRSTTFAMMRHFRQVVAAEAVLGVGILLVVPFLSGSARNQSFQKKASNLTQTVQTGTGPVKLTPSGLQAGFANYDVWLPKSTATQVGLTFASKQLAVPETTVVATAVGDGHFRATGLYTPMVGKWQVGVSQVGASAQPDTATAVFDLNVTGKKATLPKAPARKVRSSTWAWGVGDVIAVVGVLFAANRISRRRADRRSEPVDSGALPMPEAGREGMPVLVDV